MKVLIVVLSVMLATPAAALAQSAGRSSDPKAATDAGVRAEIEKMQAALKEQQAQLNPKFVRALTNVQIELTLTDQLGTNPPEKKTVTVIASSGSWGKVRSAANVHPIGEPPYSVELNVDARPFVSVDGPVQLELAFVYAPVKGSGDPKFGPAQRPSGINQSQTVILTSGKPLIVSQAADPVSDRKVIVEVKATVLK